MMDIDKLSDDEVRALQDRIARLPPPKPAPPRPAFDWLGKVVAENTPSLAGPVVEQAAKDLQASYAAKTGEVMPMEICRAAVIEGERRRQA
jgi:hypothetical protein